jgi:hypothetical protein
MNLAVQIREAMATGDLDRTAGLYGEYLRHAVEETKAGTTDPAIANEALELLTLARRVHAKQQELLTAGTA